MKKTSQNALNSSPSRAKSRARTILKYAGRVGLIVLTLLLTVVIGLYSIMFVLAKGPSPTARDLFVRSVMETSAAKFLARMYFSEEEINDIITVSDDGDDNQRTDPNLIQIPGQSSAQSKLPFDRIDDNSDDPDNPEPSNPGTENPDDPSQQDGGIEIVDVNGRTFYGKMIIVKDPSRVCVGTLPKYGSNYKGKLLRDFISDYGAIGGINAGGFADEGGSGSGAVPDGIVIRDGKIIWGSASKTYKCVVGFDKNHILHVGNMTGAQALEEGIVDGLSFSAGPVLVQNGVPETAKRKLGGGLNPRTAIGQRADGAMLLLVINGRQANAFGATYDDTCNIMASFGAVNAANLDGGSSSLMIFNGETLNQSAYIFGERKLPDVFLIMP